MTNPSYFESVEACLACTKAWSREANHCDVPGCSAAEVTVTSGVTVTVQDTDGVAKSGVKVYAFNGTNYTGFSGTSDAAGQVVFTLPQGSYRFRADYDGVQFWSSSENTCTLPGCESAQVLLPGMQGQTTVTIDYTYDPLYRLTAADYDSGEYYHYSYDSVGNRLTQEMAVGGLAPVTNSYQYDPANRLVNVDGVAYTWDNNGNLLSDGVNTYAYDAANRLSTVNGASSMVSYTYNGLGDRLQETANGSTTTFSMDLNTGLTQALSDGTYTYLYGNGRVAQEAHSAPGTSHTDYFLGDALGSVRQLTDASGAVTYAQSYDPYGQALGSATTATSYAFTGEWSDPAGMLYLRARHYSAYLNQFIQPDTIVPDPYIPADWNKYTYVRNNPVNYLDPSGHCPEGLCSGQTGNARDLTAWLYSEMKANSVNPKVRDLRRANQMAAYLATNLVCDLWEAIEIGDSNNMPPAETIKYFVAHQWSAITWVMTLHGTALYEYNLLVKNGAIWDFKDEIGLKLGPGITLCASGGCYDDIEYSVPGNIHFAYIGIAAGFPGWEIQAGAGYAEISDPAHDPNSREYAGPYIPPTFFEITGWTPWDLSTINFGDEPKDHEAVTLGIKLYEKYKGNMSFSDFKTELSKYVNRLSRCAPDPNPVEVSTPYSVGSFNNAGRVYNLPSGRCK